MKLPTVFPGLPRLLALLALACLLAVPSAPLAAAPARGKRAQEALLGKFAARYKGLTAFKASYRRSTSTPATDPVFKSQAVQTAEGVLYWKKPLGLRLAQEKPSAEELVTDGATAWWYLPAEKTVRVYEGFDLAEGFRPLTAFFDGADELKKHFLITAAQEDPSRPGATGFVLAPKEKEAGEDGAAAGTITVWCGEEAVLEGFRLSSGTGEKTDFYLDSPEINPELPEDFFRFKPPRGTAVVREEAEGGN
ncbi:MAG: outer membrane lipoprotein carrier protein LolA [Deltaproteobacteria bacterium]|jgi:outer membrane lipoprotein-sorting protein|nr:outer membrane lipoprotein carrier protein LolA [Deltaproteobacteria bacterium]